MRLYMNGTWILPSTVSHRPLTWLLFVCFSYDRAVAMIWHSASASLLSTEHGASVVDGCAFYMYV